MKVAIYARVSTEDQHCDMQLQELREYCARRGWDIAGEYVDTGWSGSKSSRPQFDKIMADAFAHRFDVIAVWKLDRWGRSVTNCLDSLERLRRAGVRWIDLTNNLDTDQHNPTSALLLHILAAVAQFERSMIQERVKGGLKSYRDAYSSGRIGRERHSKSGRDLPVGRQHRIFDHAKAIEMRRGGSSVREIARQLGVGAGTVHRLIQAVQ